MPAPRTKCVSTKVTSDDYAAFETLAGQQTLSGWAREVLLRATAAPPIELVILAEVIALRGIVVNLQFALASGDADVRRDAATDRADGPGQGRQGAGAPRVSRRGRRDDTMVTISKPLGAAQARTYHAEAFSSARDNYYTIGDRIVGQWHGQLAAQWGLRGAVSEEHFERLADGQHPFTGEPLVRHQTACEYTNARGEHVKAMAHRAGWDATFSAPKSVSLTALVGGDERVRVAHQESVAAALDETERYVQARLGGNRQAETTGNWVAATFEHDSARPVAGYAAPQLHTHAVFFNLTQTESGETVHSNRGSSIKRSNT